MNYANRLKNNRVFKFIFPLNRIISIRTFLVIKTDFLSYEIHNHKQHSEIINSANNHTKSILFLHGILGSKRNWRSACTELLKIAPSNYCTIAVDHRGHGYSPKFSTNNHTVASCANDLINLWKSFANNTYPGNVQHKEVFIDPPKIILAHSFGGKVALLYLKYLIDQNIQLPSDVWILDSIPGLYEDSLQNKSQSVLNILLIISRLPKIFPSKEWVISELRSKGLSQTIILWIATNIIFDISIEEKNEYYQINPFAEKSKESLLCKFSFDIQIILELFDDFCKVDLWDFLNTYNRKDCRIQFIRAGKNNAWKNDVMEKFENLTQNNQNIRLHTMHHVGHWLHAEDLHGVLKIITENSDLT
eukprot:gene10881-14603_t